MGDDSSRSIVKALKNEWALFWESFHNESDESPEATGEMANGKLEVLSLERVREITKALIEDRKRLNQKLESLSKEIDLNSAKLESLRLVGGEEDGTLKRIHELNDLGQNLAETLTKLDKKLREVREKENELQEEQIS
jgi:hypothetical protein